MVEVTINYLAVLVAAIASFAFGWIWHGVICGKQWMKLMGFTPKSMKKMKLSPGQAMTLGFITMLITAYVLSHFVDYLAATTFATAAQLAFWLWLGLVMPVNAGVWIWEGKPFKLFIINTIYWLISLIVMTWILAVWP